MCEVSHACPREPRWFVVTKNVAPMKIGAGFRQEGIVSNLSLLACSDHLVRALRELEKKVPGGAQVREMNVESRPRLGHERPSGHFRRTG